MLDAFIVQLLAVPFAVGAILTFAEAARRRSGIRTSRAQLIVRAKAPETAEISWKIVQAVTPFMFLLPPLFPKLVYANPLSIDAPFSIAIQLVGYGVMIAGAVLLFQSEKTLGRFLMPEIAVTENHQLIMSGPYSRVRHPLYTSVLLLYLGMALFYLNLAPAAVFLLGVTGAYGRAKAEEKLLSSDEGFGQKYREYQSRTGMFLPKIR